MCVCVCVCAYGGSRGSRLMSEVCTKKGRGSFFRSELAIEALERIGVLQVREFYSKNFLPSSSLRRKLVCSIVGGEAIEAMRQVDAQSSQLLTLFATVPPHPISLEGETGGKDDGEGKVPVSSVVANAAGGEEKVGAEEKVRGEENVQGLTTGDKYQLTTTGMGNRESGSEGGGSKAGVGNGSNGSNGMGGSHSGGGGMEKGGDGDGRKFSCRRRPRSLKPNFMKLGQGEGCGDPNCGGAC